MMRATFLMVVTGTLILCYAALAAAQDKVQAGAALFTSQKCSLCHAVAGKGNPKGPLDGVAAKRTADEIRQWIVDPDAMREKTKATRMPAMKAVKLSKEQVDALVAYLQTLK
jgi:mono/diheme cytochrome c family protein